MKKISYFFIFGILICIALLAYYFAKINSLGIKELDNHPVFSVVLMLVCLIVAFFYSKKE